MARKEQGLDLKGLFSYGPNDRLAGLEIWAFLRVLPRGFAPRSWAAGSVALDPAASVREALARGRRFSLRAEADLGGSELLWYRDGRRAVLVEGRKGHYDVQVCSDRLDAREALDAVLAALAPHRAKNEEADGAWADFSHMSPNGLKMVREFLRCPGWGDILSNYPGRARDRLERLVAAREPWARGRLLILHGDPGTGKCVASGTRVITKWGYHRIEDLHPARTPETYWDMKVPIGTVDGMKDTSHFYAGGRQSTLRLTTDCGYEVEGTPEHPLLCLRPSGELEWVALERIAREDYVAIARNVEAWGQIRIEEAYIMGVLVGDGHIVSGKTICLATADDEILGCFRAWGAKHGSKVFKGSSKYDWRITSLELVRHANESLGLKSVLAPHKRVPEPVWGADKESARQFLRGLFDADGYCERYGYLGITSASRGLIHDVQLLLLKFGIVSSRAARRASYIYKGERRRRNAWRLALMGQEAHKFYQAIGFALPRKQAGFSSLPTRFNTNKDVVPYVGQFLPKNRETRKYGYHAGKRPSYTTLERLVQKYNVSHPTLDWVLKHRPFWTRVKAKDASRAEVFDVTVPDGHAFVSNGFVSHNTYFIRSLMMAWRDRFNFLVVTDPERLAADPGYYFATASQSGERPMAHGIARRWGLGDEAQEDRAPKRVCFILEDSADLVIQESRTAHYDKINKLLNVTDGLFGQGREDLFVLTFNERVDRIDPAFLRPGRCLAKVEFPRFPAGEAAAWLAARGGPPPNGAAAGAAADAAGMTLAEMYAHLHGDAADAQPAPARRGF